jgi:histidyl-tRNA synthetase
MDRFTPPRGTMDYAPAEALELGSMGRALEDTFGAHAYLPVRTPMFERFALLAARAGDAIRESMFTFVSERVEYALRPEMTAPVCRMLASGALGAGPVHRVCYSGPCFRYVRTGARRRREFTQSGAELFGLPGLEGDAEVLSLALDAVAALGLTGAVVRVGHIGAFGSALAGLSDTQRATAVSLLDDAMTLATRCECYVASGGTEEDPAAWMRDSVAGVYRLQRRVGAEEGDAVRPPAEYDAATMRDLAERLPSAARATTRRALEHLAGLDADLAGRLVEATAVHGDGAEVAAAGGRLLGEAAAPALAELAALCARVGQTSGVTLEASLGVARGFEFYTGMVFEILVPALGGDPVIGGGGRYDNLVAEIGGPETPAAGFALEVEQAVSARRAINGGESVR